MSQPPDPACLVPSVVLTSSCPQHCHAIALRDGCCASITRELNVEASYAFGCTRISGEWTRDTFDLPGPTAVTRGVTAQIQHTLTPRIFLHARATVVTSPEIFLAGPIDRTFRSLDTTFGYRRWW